MASHTFWILRVPVHPSEKHTKLLRCRPLIEYGLENSHPDHSRSIDPSEETAEELPCGNFQRKSNRAMEKSCASPEMVRILGKIPNLHHEMVSAEAVTLFSQADIIIQSWCWNADVSSIKIASVAWFKYIKSTIFAGEPPVLTPNSPKTEAQRVFRVIPQCRKVHNLRLSAE